MYYVYMYACMYVWYVYMYVCMYVYHGNITIDGKKYKNEMCHCENLG
jgi:hypothetical protein